MMTYTMQEADLLSDERLVGLTLEGDRDAFGQIVARYHSPICALAYSACGSITRSEDLAQEVFIAAWRKLRELRDPAKLKSWLYAIARNLINTAFRQQTRNPLISADPLDEVLESSSEFDVPSETAISKEEETILWQVLSGMPETYRQPMVLFYRQEESIASVAEILGISEEGVRQRLSRGRAMLNERVAKVVEIGLRRSGPTKAFGQAVLAALPAASLKAGTVGTATAAANTSSALSGVGVVSALASIVSSVGSVAGALIGFWGRIQNARTVRERKFAIRTVWGLLAFALVLVIINRLLFAHQVFRMSTQPSGAIVCSLVMLGELGPLFLFSIWRGRQQRRIQVEEGTVGANPTWWIWRLDPAQRGFKAATFGMLACLMFGACGWLMINAIQVNDHLMLALLLVLAFGGWLLSAAAAMRCPERTPKILSVVWWGLALVNLIVVNLRWDSWFGGASVLQFSSRLAPWTVSYLIVFFCATAQVGWWLRRLFLTLPEARWAARIAVAVYLALLLSGLALLAVVK
jgi:RNA polymerase sigma factor (sigma-70 family)